MNKIGIDIGGTKIEAVLMTEKGNTLFRKRIPTEAHFGYKHILRRIGILVKEVIKNCNHLPSIVGVGSPGSICPETGLLRNSNTLCLNSKPLKELIEEEIGFSVIIENDANCFTLAETLMGAGRNFQNVFGVILGTGCGGGIVINGKRFLGNNLIAGEWGHHCIDINGRECWCGNKGCVETYLSGSGIEKYYNKITGEKMSAKDLFASKSEIAIKIKKNFYDFFGRSIANVYNILDPDVVVIGGGLSNDEGIYTEGLNSVKKYIFSSNSKIKIVKNLLGDSAGVIGAALLKKN